MLRPREITYQQRATVKGVPQERLFKTMKSWLINNHCAITETDPPKSIKAYYSAKFPMFQLGLSDTAPKQIDIGINSLGDDSIMSMFFTQDVPRLGESGFLFWGSKLEQLYGELGVPLDPYTLSQLYPAGWVRREIRKTVTLYALFALLSIALILGLNISTDMAATYAFVVFLPSTFMAGVDINEHRSLLKKTAK